MQGLREVRCPQRTLFSEASANRLRRGISLRASGLHHSKKNLENRLRGLYKTHKLTNSGTQSAGLSIHDENSLGINYKVRLGTQITQIPQI